MISQKAVLTATPVVLERVPAGVKLYDKTSEIVQGLTNATLSVEGYTLDNIATELPENTKEASEHSTQLELVVESIAPIIRQSMSAIAKYVIPTCDRFEAALKQSFDQDKLMDYVFGYANINPFIVSRSLMNSIVFDVTPDPDLLNGMLYSYPDLDNVSVKEYTAGAVKGLVAEVINTPELSKVFESEEDVLGGFEALFRPVWWLVGNNPNGKSIDVRNIVIEPVHLNKLIILNTLLYKLSSLDEPLDGILGLSLEDYRRHIASLKRYISTLMVLTKRRITMLLEQGIVFAKANSYGYDFINDEYSSFNKARVIRGDIGVYVSEEVLDFFSESDTYSLSETVLGMILAKEKNVSFPSNGILERVPAYAELLKQYYEELRTALSNNIRTCSKNALRDAVIDLANNGLWKDYLDGIEGQNNTSKFESLLEKEGGYLDILTNPSFVSSVVSGNRRIANTVVAVRLANALGAPIAAEILENSLSVDASSQEEQRINLAKSIAKAVVSKLLK